MARLARLGRGVLARAVLAALAALRLAAAHAQTWEASLDVRVLDSDAGRSYLNGGLAPVRFGSDQSGVQLGRARFALSEPFAQILMLKLDASAWGDHDKSPVDLTEAYLEVRPYPVAGWRLRVKAGAFYAPVSLENRAAGWESPYTLSFSALDGWIAEELRTIGLQTQVEWLGSRLGYPFDVALVAAAFGWNEPAGVAIANNGFVLSDRQTTLFGRVGIPGGKPVSGFELFREIDGRVGTYGGLELRYLDRLTLTALHYDNHADPSAFDPAINEHAWATHFSTAGLRLEGPCDWTLIAQWLAGETYVAPAGFGELGWDFDTRYLLLSRTFGRHNRLSARYDSFSVGPEQPVTRGAQEGHAVTVAYAFEPDEHWRLMLEWLQVRASQSNRLYYYGQDPFATDTLVQLSVRYAIGGP